MELNDINLRELIEKETGNKFERSGYIKCPFHNEKTPSMKVKFHPDTNKEKFKCFGCNEGGDALDFVVKYKSMSFNEAKKYLGLSVEKTLVELMQEKVKSFIEWELTKYREGQELVSIFNFVDSINKPIYFKAKFIDHNDNDKKKCGYYHIENEKVVANRGNEEVPYNLYRVLQAIKDNKTIVICEGEKDANTVNSILRGENFEATSIKGITTDLSILYRANIYVCSDTGKGGEIYKWHVHETLFEKSKSFKFVNLPGIQSLGDNKDVTDWLDSGHTKKDLLNAFNRSLDLKSKYELQQDFLGIYKYVTKGKGDDAELVKVYMTNFRLISAKRIKFIEEDEEGVKLILKSSTGETIERVGFSSVFDDTKTFKNFLGTIDLGFKGKVDDLTDLKAWINRYFALEVEEVYNGVQFIRKNEELLLITCAGALSKDKVIPHIKNDGRSEISIPSIEPITKDELKELKRYIFRFSTPDKTCSIIGTIINNLAVVQNKESGNKLHHLLIVGESGGGKSTILENIISPILNYPLKEKLSLGIETSFTLVKNPTYGNYSIIYEEHKPSMWDRYKIAKVSEVLRNSYDRSTISRGDKSLGTRYFQLSRPFIIIGEEGYYGSEKALIERSCIVYLSKNERTKDSTEVVEWIKDNKKILNKLGRSLVDVVLGISTEEYQSIRDKVEKSITDLKDRPLSTAVNICTGIEIFNILQKKLGLKEIKIKNYVDKVVSNIQSEVLEDGAEAHSIVEQMICLYNDMIEDNRASDVSGVVRYRGDGIFIKTSEMINQIYEHINRIGSDISPISLKDFRKQAKKAGYILGLGDKVIKSGNKPIRFDTYSADKLRELKINSIIPPEMELVEEKDNVIPFK